MTDNHDRKSNRKEALKAYFLDVIRGKQPDAPDGVPEVPPVSEEASKDDDRVTFDCKGNPVWNLDADAPNSDDLDSTFDMLSPLDAELSIDESGCEPPPDQRGKDPYNSTED